MAWTTTDLIADVRRRAFLPSTVTLGTQDADILAVADSEMAARLVPLVLSCNEEYYVSTTDVAVVAGKAAYRVPNRNVGGKLRDLTYVVGSTQYNLARIEPERLTQWTLNGSGTPQAFYLESGTVNLVPAPQGGGTLRMKYYQRPGRLTATNNNWGVITAVTYASANSVTLTWTGSLNASNGSKYDVIAFRPPFEYLLADAVASGAGSSTCTLTITSPTNPPPDFSLNVAVGDYITVADASPVLQLPVELHPLLAQRVVCAMMETFSYGDRLQMANDTYSRMEAAALRMLEPRVDGAPKKMRGLIGNLGVGGWLR